MYRGGVKGEQLRFQVFLASVDPGVGVDRRVLVIARATLGHYSIFRVYTFRRMQAYAGVYM